MNSSLIFCRAGRATRGLAPQPSRCFTRLKKTGRAEIGFYNGFAFCPVWEKKTECGTEVCPAVACFLSSKKKDRAARKFHPKTRSKQKAPPFGRGLLFLKNRMCDY